MKRITSYLLPCALLLTTQTSCGYEDVLIELYEASNIEISQHTLDIWEGDTLSLGCQVSFRNGEPQTDMGDSNTYYWYTREDFTTVGVAYQDPDSLFYVSMSGPRVTARRQGETWIYVQCFGLGQSITSAITPESVVDSCLVRVINWQDSLRFTHYPYDMAICAALTYQGKPVSERMELCAMVDGEVRGYGEHRTEHGIDYFYLRIYGREPQGEEVKLRAYDHERICCYDLPISYLFDGETHGTLSNLVKINIQ